ncbi:LysR family transcriptional regulator [Rhodoferax sediminis]|uniref:LysR family transcriptional regulator n=1 Tax=Rhodoferax sediminis TaxID=2509614 RepID=A0A515DE84_9BURK|nr:LysR family transcriptional regulator [Rhodoferax sediminis]
MGIAAPGEPTEPKLVDSNTCVSSNLTDGNFNQVDINIARLDLISIRLVIVCAELGSLSAAAKRTHCSISAASQRLKALEASIGRALFVRDYRGLRLTDAGDVLVAHGKLVFGQLELMRDQVGSISFREGFHSA